MSVFDRIRKGLARTAAEFVSRLEEVLGDAEEPAARTRPIDVDTLDALEEALVSADVGVAATERIVATVRAREGRGADLRALVKAELLRILEEADRPPATGRPRVVLVVGVNGTGKTTTVGKLASLARADGQAPLICAADTFRAAAVEQLAVWAERAGVDLVRGPAGAIR